MGGGPRFRWCCYDMYIITAGCLHDAIITQGTARSLLDIPSMPSLLSEFRPTRKEIKYSLRRCSVYKCNTLMIILRFAGLCGNYPSFGGLEGPEKVKYVTVSAFMPASVMHTVNTWTLSLSLPLPRVVQSTTWGLGPRLAKRNTGIGIPSTRQDNVRKRVFAGPRTHAHTHARTDLR